MVSTSSWNEVDIVSDTPLERTPLPFAGRQVFITASFLVRDDETLCFSSSLSARTLSGLTYVGLMHASA